MNTIHNFFLLLFVGMLTKSSYSQIKDTVRIGQVTVWEHYIQQQKQAGVKKQKIDTLVLSSFGSNSLSQVLSENTPVFIKSYGRGSMASASFRGTAPSHTKVLWNDMEINNPMLGMVDFSLIPTWFTDDVSLAYGAASIQKTSGALGGSIELNNKAEWNKGLHFHTLSSIGEYHSYDHFFTGSYSSKKYSSKSKAFYSSSENNFSFINRDVISSVNLTNGEKQHPKQEQTQAEYEKFGFLQEFYYRASDQDVLSTKIWWQKSDRNLPMLSSDEKNKRKELDEKIESNNFNKQYDESLRAVVKWKHYGDFLNYSTNFGYIQNDLDYYYDVRLYDGSLNRRIDSKSKVNSYFAKAALSYSINDKSKINSTFNWQKHKVDSKEGINETGYEEDRSEMNFHVHAEHYWTPSLIQSISIQNPITDGNFDPLIWVAGLQYQLIKKNVMRTQINISRNFHRPTLNDLYFQPGGNPDLKAEKAYTAELDLGYSILQPSFQIDMDITAYHSDIDNWILWLPAGNRGYWEPMNLKKVETKGLEMKVKLSGKVGKNFSYQLVANYAITKSINKSEKHGDDDVSYNKQLPYVPEKSANIISSLQWKQSCLSSHFNYYNERYTTTSNELNTFRDYLYPYYMNDISLSQNIRLSEKVSSKLQIKINNVFDEEYRSVLQRPMPGRNYTLLMEFKF